MMKHSLKLADDGTTVEKYPYYFADLQRDHPNTSFPYPVGDTDLSEFGVREVALVTEPVAELDEQVAEGMPVLVDGIWSQNWLVSAADDNVVQARRQALVDDIDNACAAIYARVGRFAEEYKVREADALAFQAAGYTGAVPRQVAAFATPAGVSATYAANLILSQATQLRGALAALGEQRMCKYQVKTAPAAVATALHAEVMATIASIGAAL